jgi:hypothetical protein
VTTDPSRDIANERNALMAVALLKLQLRATRTWLVASDFLRPLLASATRFLKEWRRPGPLKGDEPLSDELNQSRLLAVFFCLWRARHNVSRHFLKSLLCIPRTSAIGKYDSILTADRNQCSYRFYSRISGRRWFSIKSHAAIASPRSERHNGQFAYVSVSRASQDAQIFTNDATTLAESLSRDVSKTSALDFGKQQAPVPKLAPEQSQLVKRSPGPGFGLAL